MAERQESGRSLREALEKLANEQERIRPHDLCDLLAAHPAEPAPEVVVDHRPGETCSVAAEVDPETGFARVLLDREAVAAIYRGHYQQHGPGIVSGKPFQSRCVCGTEYGHGKFNGHLTDLVMELARPMPTQQAVREAIAAHLPSQWVEYEEEGGSISAVAAAAVLTLINTTEGVTPVNQHLTPDEVEVGRRNLIAELKLHFGDTFGDVLLARQTVADLIAVLEASKPAGVSNPQYVGTRPGLTCPSCQKSRYDGSYCLDCGWRNPKPEVSGHTPE